MAVNDCQACEAEPSVGVASSVLGPLSLAYGRNCLRNHAEPMWLFEATFGAEGDRLKNMLRGGGLAEWARELSVYVDGRYRNIMEWANDEQV